MIAGWFHKVVILNRFLNATYRSLCLLQIIICSLSVLWYTQALFGLTKKPLFPGWWKTWGCVCILGFLFWTFQRCCCSSICLGTGSPCPSTWLSNHQHWVSRPCLWKMNFTRVWWKKLVVFLFIFSLRSSGFAWTWNFTQPLTTSNPCVLSSLCRHQIDGLNVV